MEEEEGGGGSGGGGGGAAVAVHACDVADTTAYVSYDGRGGPPTVLAHDDRADIDGFVTSPSTGELEAVMITAARSELVAVTEGGKRLQDELARVRETLDGRREDETLTVVATSRTRADDLWVVRSDSDCEAARFYLHVPYQAQSKRRAPRLLLTARHELESLPLSPTVALFIAARDGERLPAYLTRPTRGVGPPGPMPLALLVHGGPNARDYAGFDPVIQLLVARGIAVLSVNYRGSTGFGNRYYNLGIGNVRGMHEDVEDARRWAITSGLADPDRIAIVGASWGGYLALGGATKVAAEAEEEGEEERARYAAVVAIVALVAVGACNTSPAFRSDPLVTQYWKQLYGPSVSSDQQAAEALSPLHRLDELDPSVKLLLVHGERDPRVPREHGDAVANAARARGIAGAHLTYAAEGHAIRREPNVLHLWHRVERFLCAALELPPPPALDAPELTEKHTCTVHWDAVGLEPEAPGDEPRCRNVDRCVRSRS